MGIYNKTKCDCFVGFDGKICHLNKKMQFYWAMFHLCLGWYFITMTLITMWLICVPKPQSQVRRNNNTFNPKQVAIILMISCITGICQEALWHIADQTPIEWL